MSKEVYLNNFIEACKTHGSKTVEAEDYKSINKAYKSIIKNFKVLIQDETGKNMLKNLLVHEDKYVSSWTATLLVFEYPKECEIVLKAISKEKGIWAGSIRTFYEEWKKGTIERVY